MGERAREGWRRWNREWDEPLYHEVGGMFLTRAPMSPGGFEYESYQMLLRRGHHPERLDSAAIARRFAAWNADLYDALEGKPNPDLAKFQPRGLTDATSGQEGARYHG